MSNQYKYKEGQARRISVLETPAPTDIFYEKRAQNHYCPLRTPCTQFAELGNILIGYVKMQKLSCHEMTGLQLKSRSLSRSIHLVRSDIFEVCRSAVLLGKPVGAGEELAGVTARALR